MKLRFLESSWVPFAQTLCSRQDVETAGVILAERVADGLLIARDLTSDWLNPFLFKARRLFTSVVLVTMAW